MNLLKARKAAVIGDPVAHSQSPSLFATLAKERGPVDLRYSKLHIKAPDLASAIHALRQQPEYIGFNVTLPHKETILAYLDDLSPEARAIGAVNVVHCQRDGRWLGYNTDVLGVMRTLERNDVQVKGREVFQFGAGGAARATAYAMGALGARRVWIQNRTLDRAEKLAHEMSKIFPRTEFGSVTQLGLIPADSDLALIVNTTSVGMVGCTHVELNMSNLPFTQDTVAFDLVYTPEYTSFLKCASDQGFRTLGGLEMLMHQACATWDQWFAPKRPIIVTGFMGVGKSTIGARIAQKLGWEFIDTDEQITKMTGKSISQIFAEGAEKDDGEFAFRMLEREVITQLSQLRSERTVVALGGGTLLDPENLRRVQGLGTLVYLSATPQGLQTRLLSLNPKSTADSPRPLLKNGDLAELLALRSPGYEHAEIHIHTDHKTPDEIVHEVMGEVLGL